MHGFIYQLAGSSILMVAICLLHRLWGGWSLLISPTMITGKHGRVLSNPRIPRVKPGPVWCCFICENYSIIERFKPTSVEHPDMQCGLLTCFACIPFPTFTCCLILQHSKVTVLHPLSFISSQDTSLTSL